MNREREENRLSRRSSRSSAKISRKSSNLSEIPGEEKKIFEDLERIGQEEDQLLYVDGFKRFGTNKNLKQQDTLMRAQKNERRNNLFRKGISRFDTLRIGSKSKKRKRYVIKKGFDVNKIYRKRKICRLLSFCCFTISLIIFITLMYFFGWTRDQFELDFDKEIEFSLRNCRIFFNNCDGCGSYQIELDHRIGISDIFGDFSLTHNTFVTKTIDDTKLSYKVTQNGDIRGCNVKILVPVNQAVKKLSISCDEKCVVIQQGSLEITDLEVKGESVYMNFQDITLERANVNITKGQVQMNKASFSSSGSYYLEVGHGDIIVQTTDDLNVRLKTASENYCFSSETSQVVTAITQSPISTDFSFYRTQAHVQDNLFNNQWEGEVSICKSTCTSPITIETVNFEGNIYANILNQIPGAPLKETANIIKGSNYEKWYDIGYFAKENIANMIDQTKDKSLPNLILKINVGNYDAWAVQSETWVYTEHRLYSIAKPWWLSVFTLTRLVENTRTIDTFLSPGICPFKHFFKIEERFNIQETISQNMPNTGILSFVHSTADDLNPSDDKTSDGFKKFNTSPNFSDEWISVVREGGLNLQYLIWNLTDHFDVFYILWGSIVFCCIATVYTTSYFYRWIMDLQRFILNKILHINLYWKIYQKISFSSSGFNESFIDGEEVENFKKQQAELILSQGNISLLTLSSAMSFIDFCLTEIINAQSESLQRFLDLVFEETDHDHLMDDEMQSAQNDKISMKAFKSLYHQFCLMNNCKEASLGTENAKQMIKQRGFMVTSSETHSTFYLVRISFKDKTEVNLNLVDLESKSSLSLFIENYCNYTEFDEDKIAFGQFMQQYDLFCRMNHLDKILIDHILLKNQYDIEFKRIVKEMIERDPDYNPSAPLNYSDSKIKRALTKCFRALRRKKFYKFNPKKLERINLFLAGNLNSKDTPKREFIKIVTYAILFKGWRLFDFSVVILEISIKMVLTIPFLSIFIFQEIEHSIYSIRDEKISVYGFNVSTNDIWLVPQKIFRNTILTVVVILFLAFWFFSIFFIIYDAVFLEFPWMNQFKPTRRLKFRNFVTAYQWCFIIASVYSICAYILCVVIWDILAAIVKPDAYIVSTSMAISLLFLVFSLKDQFAKIDINSELRFNKIYKVMWEDRIRLISKKMKKSVAKTQKEEIEMIEEVDEFNYSFQEKIKIAKLSMRRFIQDQPSCKPLIDYLFSSLGKDKVEQKEKFEIFCSSPPLLLHDYMIQLIGNVMFQTISMKNDRFNVEKNIRLVASLIFYYSENELVPITLKEISVLRACGCDDKTLIDKGGYCEGCKSKGDSYYSDRQLRKKILKVKISENAKIMVYMLEILSNLQKRSINDVIKIIEKTFSESYPTDAFEKVKPIFDLINIIVFDLGEKFDFNRLSEIFLDFMKHSMQSNLYLTEILMIYILRDDILMTSDIGEVYDSLSITNLFKRQICSVENSTKERKMFVKYLSLASAFYSKEDEISESLIWEFTNSINSEYKSLVKVPISLIYCLLHIPMYFRYRPFETVKRIKTHAEDHRIPDDLSNFLLYFKLISKNVDSITEPNLVPHTKVKKSTIYVKIKKFFSMSSSELLGLIHLLKGNTNNNQFQKILHIALRKNNLEEYYSFVFDIIMITHSNDKIKLKKVFKIFLKYLDSEKMHNKLLNLFLHLRMPTDKDKKYSNKKNIMFSDIYDSFPTKKSEGGESLERRMKDLFLMSCIKKDYPNFKIFKELYFKMIRKSRDLQQLDEESLTVFYLVDLCFAVNFENDKSEILLKFKKFMTDLENPLLYNFLVQLLRVIDGFSVEVGNRVKERLKPTFEILGELIFERPSSLMKLWNIIYSLQYTDKLEGLRFFLTNEVMNRLDLDKRLKTHLLFVNKRVDFIKNQGRFIDRYIYEFDDDNSLYFSVSCLKITVLKGINFNSLEIVQLLFSLIKQIDKEKKIQIEGTNPHKIFKFYSYIFNYLVSNDTFSLSKFFNDQGEPMISQLCSCLNNPSYTLRLNSILTQLVMNEKKSLAAIYHFYFTLVGKIKRFKVSFRMVLEKEINDWISIKPQFMEFIELYVYRTQENFDERIYKIQNRILLNTNMKIEDSQNYGMKSDIISQETIKNICSLIDGEVPSIKFFSSLFKIEEDKLSLIYTLNSLKKDDKFDKTLEILRLDKNIKNLMALQGINLEELFFLLKVCLNKMDYDSITEFLKLLNLDMIVPDILFNLLLIDKKVSKEMIPMRNFNKEFLVHSTIFEKLGISREMAWAFFRVLKGDFLIFKELIDILYDEFFPQNHKKFINIICGLIGLKNVHIDPSDVKVDWEVGITKYAKELKEKFHTFKHDEVKEVSLQYAQYMLHEHFSLNPLWVPMLYSVESEKEKKASTESDSIQIMLAEEIKFRNSKHMEDDHDPEGSLSLMQIIALNALMNVDETILMFIYDLALFKNIRAFLDKKDLVKNMGLTSLYEMEIGNLKQFFSNRIREYKDIFKKLIFFKIIPFDIEIIQEANSKSSPVTENLLIRFGKLKGSVVKKEEFNLMFNKITLKYWENYLRITQQNDDDKLIKKITEILDSSEQLSKPIFDMFVTADNLMKRSYWERKFDKVEYLDSYLDVMIDYMLEELDLLSKHLDTVFYKNYSKTKGAFMDTETENDINEETVKKMMRKMFFKHSNDKIKLKLSNKTEIHVAWSDAIIQALVLRFRPYVNMSSDEKSDKMSMIMYKSDLVFNILEKFMFFDRTSHTFTKFNYLCDFNLSNGVIMMQKSFVKSSASLFIPELVVYINEIISKHESFSDSQYHTETDVLFARIKIISKIFENDREYFKTSGIFKQFTFKQAFDKIYVHEGKLNLRFFRTNLLCVKNTYQYDVKEKTIPLAMQYYIPMFMIKKEYREDNELRGKYIKGVLKRACSIKGKYKIKQNIRIFDPTLISLALLEENTIYDMKTTRFQSLIDELSLDYFTRKFSSYAEKSPTKIKLFYLEMIPYYKFLNDLALGKYNVLSETKNIFSEDYELNNYQKVYEAILYLHNSRKTFDHRRLETALGILSTNLKSNASNLEYILEFVLNYNDEAQASLGIFKQLDITNQTFYHIFNLHNYTEEIRIKWINEIVSDYFIQPEYVKKNLANIINFIYLVKNRKERNKLSKEQFKLMAHGIIGEFQDKEKKRKYDNLIDATYSIIHFRESDSKKITRSTDKKILRLYALFDDISPSKERITKSLIEKANELTFSVYNGNVLSYLSKLDYEENKDLISEIMKVKNPALLEVFKVISWVKSRHKDLPYANIKENLHKLIKGGNLGLSSSTEVTEKMKQLFIFFRAFINSDIFGILEFLWELQMKSEYTYILSNYLYSGIISGWLNKDLYDNESAKEQMGTILCYPLLHLICYSLKRKSKDHGKNYKGRKILNQLPAMLLELQNTIFHGKYHKVLQYIDSKKKKSDASLDALLTGKLFKVFNKPISKQLKRMISGFEEQEVIEVFHKIKFLYIFSPEFYQNQDFETSVKIQELVEGAIKLRDNWNSLDNYFKKNDRNLHYTKPKELLSKIKKASNELDFAFLNPTEEDEHQLKRVILPMMMFTFLFLKRVRKHIEKNDNASQLRLLKASLTFVWAMCTTTKKNPLEDLGFEYDVKVEFLNKYTNLIFCLKTKKSNLFILNELLKFIRKYILMVKSNFKVIKLDPQERKDNVAKGTLDELLYTLRLDSLMELYDYMEDMIIGKRYSESNKENILHLVIQILSVYREFKKNKEDVRKLVKLIQGDLNALEYCINKVFFRDDNASYALNVFKSLFKEKLEMKRNKIIEIEKRGKDFFGFENIDHDKIMKRAEEGQCNYKDLYVLMKGDMTKADSILFSDLRVILRRLGLNPTQHRMAEFISAAKQKRLQNSVGTAFLNINTINLTEFPYIFEYIQERIFDDTLQSLKISKSHLATFSIISCVIFLINLNYISNVVTNVFGGGLLAASLCALIPLTTIFVITRQKSVNIFRKDICKIYIEENFENVTNSSGDFLG